MLSNGLTLIIPTFYLQFVYLVLFFNYIFPFFVMDVWQQVLLAKFSTHISRRPPF